MVAGACPFTTAASKIAMLRCCRGHELCDCCFGSNQPKKKGASFKEILQNMDGCMDSGSDFNDFPDYHFF